MKKIIINISLIITFIIIYLLQINFFGSIKIARGNAKLNYYIRVIYWAFFYTSDRHNLWGFIRNIYRFNFG